MPFFFDIETGGFSPEKSSILSISGAANKDVVKSFYARPEGEISEWSKTNVWRPIQESGGKISTERSSLRRFLGQLRRLPQGSTLAGWNIGYGSGSGFDIPFTLARAEKYGLGVGFRQALSRLQVRDVGQEYAYRVASEVSQYKHLVEQGRISPAIFGQAESYSKVGKFAFPGVGTPANVVAKDVAQRGYIFSGWKQEDLYKLFIGKKYAAHMSAADVSAGFELMEYLKNPKLFKSETQVVKWGREAFYRSLRSQFAHASRTDQNLQTKYSSLLGQASELEKTGGIEYKGFGKRVASGLIEEVPGFSRNISRPISISKVTDIGRSAIKRIRAAPTGFKVAAGLAVGLLGLYALQPGSYFNGFQEKGEAQKGRRSLTDFGSGWQGIFGRAKNVASWMLKENIRAVSGITKEIIHGTRSLQLLETATTGATLLEAGHTVHSIVAAGGVTPGIAIGAAAGLAGTKYAYELIAKRKFLKEAFTMARSDPTTSKLVAKYTGKTGFKTIKDYLLKGKRNPITAYIEGGGGEYGKQRFLASVETSPGFSGFDDLYNTIEGLGHGTEAERLRKLLTDFGSGYQGLDLNDDKTISPLEKRFGGFARALHKYGVETGTGHKRIYIPKDILSEEDVGKLGFTAVKVAIPESGQTRFESFRHTNALYHLHEHGQSWTLHEDIDPSMTMSLKQWSVQKAKGIQTGIGDLPSRIYAGMKHIFTEGIPGAYYYLKGKIAGGEDMLKRIQEEISPQYKSLVKRWRTQQRRTFSGFGRIYNTIEGLFHGGQAERKRKELTEFGSGWRGLFSKIVRPFTFAGRVERGYKSLLKYSLKAKGIPTRGMKFDYVDIMEGGVLDITLLARGKAGDPIASITRSLSPKEIYLTSIEAAQRGRGLGGEIYRREAGMLRKLGYKHGTRVVSPVSNPITARWQSRIYGSRPVNKVIEDDFLFRLQKGRISHDEFTSKYAGEYVGKLGFDGFVESGLAAQTRKSYGFGSGRIWDRILTFARGIFKNPKSATSIERLTSPMSATQIENIFGRESFSFSPEQIRSGLMDSFISSKQSAREAIKATKSLNQSQEALFERMISPIAPHKQARIFGGEAKIVGAEEIRQMSTAELYGKVKYNAPAMAERPKGFEDEVQRMLSQNKTERIQSRQALHTKAQVDLWKNATQSGRGHRSMTSNTKVLK